MRTPGWMNAMVGEFGKAAGVGALALNDRGAAALDFDTGYSLRLEYTGEELVIAVMTPPIAFHLDTLKRLLALAHPSTQAHFRIRTGIMPKTGRAVLAVRLREREATLPTLNASFDILWRLASEIGGQT